MSLEPSTSEKVLWIK